MPPNGNKDNIVMYIALVSFSEPSYLQQYNRKFPVEWFDQIWIPDTVFFYILLEDAIGTWDTSSNKTKHTGKGAKVHT